MSLITSRMMKLVGHGACVGEMRNTYWVIVGKPEGRRPLGRHRQNRENNIKWILNIVGGYGLGWLRVGTSGGVS
jgi:hypothetical protein